MAVKATSLFTSIASLLLSIVLRIGSSMTEKHCGKNLNTYLDPDEWESKIKKFNTEKYRVNKNLVCFEYPRKQRNQCQTFLASLPRSLLELQQKCRLRCTAPTRGVCMSCLRSSIEKWEKSGGLKPFYVTEGATYSVC